MNKHVIQVARIILGFSWIYHGLLPKMITIAPIEKALTATIGLSDQASYWVTKSAGIAEIIFGLAILAFYKNAALVKLNILALVALCLFVAVQMPNLLIEAFNPVTTNLSLIGLSYVLLHANDI